jgi:tetratricopeptide (TPR) repeat protein
MQDKEDRFNNVVTVLILLATVWTGFLAWVQSVDGDRQGDAGRDAQLASVQALTAHSAAIQRNSYEARLLARYDDLTIQSNASGTSAREFEDGGNVFDARQARLNAERLLSARDTVAPFSPAFTETRILDAEGRPDLYQRAPEHFESAFRAEENQVLLFKLSNAVLAKTNAYVLMITLAAIALFLYGLSLTIELAAARAIFAGLATLIVAGSIGAFLILHGQPEPSLSEEAVAALARGRVAAEKGDPDAAVKQFTIAIEAAGGPQGYARAYVRRGQAQAARGDHQAAIADFTQAIALEPDADAFSARGWSYLELDDPVKAEADFRQAVALVPDSDDDLNSLGWAQYLNGDYAGSIAAFRKAAAINGRMPTYQFNLGVALLASGDRAGGEAAYQQGLELARGKPVDLVGWQLQSALNDLDALRSAPPVSMTDALTRTIDGLAARSRDLLNEAGAQIDEVVFASGADGDQPADRLKVFEPGTREVHVFLSYSGFVDGARWSDVWYVNGERSDALTSIDSLWDAGAAGTTHFSLTTDESGLTPGEYKVEFRAGDRLIRADAFRVRPTDAQFGDLVFAEGVDEQGEPVNPGYSFPAGVTEIQGLFEYADMTDGLKWSALWWRGDAEIDTGLAAAPTWTLGAGGVTAVALTSDAPLDPGEYTLVLLVEGDVFQAGAFRIIEPTNLFTDIVFAPAVDANNQPVSTTDVFTAGIAQVYAVFDYAGLQDGTDWSATWYLDGKPISHSEGVWRGGASGTTWVALSDEKGLLPGQYDLELVVNGKIAQVGTVTVK